MRDALFIHELPDNSILDPESASFCGHTKAAITRNESPGGDGFQQPLALHMIRGLGGETRAQLDKFVPGILEAGLGSLVGVDETRVCFRVMSDHCKGSLVVEPRRVRPLRNEGTPYETCVASGQKSEEI